MTLSTLAAGGKRSNAAAAIGVPVGVVQQRHRLGKRICFSLANSKIRLPKNNVLKSASVMKRKLSCMHPYPNGKELVTGRNEARFGSEGLMLFLPIGWKQFVA